MKLKPSYNTHEIEQWLKTINNILNKDNSHIISLRLNRHSEDGSYSTRFSQEFVDDVISLVENNKVDEVSNNDIIIYDIVDEIEKVIIGSYLSKEDAQTTLDNFTIKNYRKAKIIFTLINEIKNKIIQVESNFNFTYKGFEQEKETKRIEYVNQHVSLLERNLVNCEIPKVFRALLTNNININERILTNTIINETIKIDFNEIEKLIRTNFSEFKYVAALPDLVAVGKYTPNEFDKMSFDEYMKSVIEEMGIYDGPGDEIQVPEDQIVNYNKIVNMMDNLKDDVNVEKPVEETNVMSRGAKFRSRKRS